MIAKQRDHGEFPQSPAADRDRNERHANHHREQHGSIGNRQHEALRAAERPNDHDGERVDETSERQDDRAPWPDKNDAPRQSKFPSRGKKWHSRMSDDREPSSNF